MSIRHCVETSRIATTRSHICLLCLCSFRGKGFPKKVSTRHYAAAANAAPKRHASPNTPSTSSSSPPFSSKNDEIDSSGNTSAKKSNRRQARNRKKAEKEVQEEEIRRKALATLDKSTKFIAAGLDQSKAEPTLSDLDFFKPASPPPFGLDFVYPEATAFLRPRAPKDSALDGYDAMFNKLVNTLTSKFNKKQLVALYKKGIDRPTPKGQGQPRPMKKLKTTRDFAAEIVRWRWKWPYLKELVDRKTYLTTKTERTFHLRTNEFFLLLGQNGSTFHELTNQYGVTLTKVERTKTGFDLSVTGLCYSLDQLAVVLKKRREQIIRELMTPESFSKPSSGYFVYEDSLRRISKHTDALVEELSSGKFQISALDATNISAAKRLVIRTQQQLMHRPPSFATVGDINMEQYSLFPLDIYGPNMMPLHWSSSSTLDILNSDHTISCAGRTGVPSPEAHNSISLPSIFRIRKIMHTFGVMHSSQQISDDSFMSNTGLYNNDENILDQPNFLGEARHKRVTASFGQIAFIPTKAARTSLISPLPSPFSFSRLFEWMQSDTSKIAFIPEIPPPLAKFSIPARNIASTRLVYRMIASDPGDSTFPILTFDIKSNRDRLKEQPMPSSSFSPPSSTTRTPTASLDISADLRDMFADEIKGVSGGNLDYSLQHSFESDRRERELLSTAVQIWDSKENVVDLSLPSRPRDIRFSSSESLRISLSDVPTEMQDYIGQHVASSPDSVPPHPPPLILRYKDSTYTLDLYASVKSSIHGTPGHGLPVIIEEVTDHESNEQSMRCLINCFDTSNARDWETFLNCCDVLNRCEDTVFAKENVNFNLV